jgi:putative nucleotidyltransferase with HDIG domain
MNKQKFQELTIAILTDTASDEENSMHVETLQNEEWAQEVYESTCHTHNLLTQTFRTLSDPANLSPAQTSRDQLVRMFEMMDQQAPLRGSAIADKEIYSDLVSKLDKLPTLPIILDAISKALNDEHANVLKIEELLNGDQSLTSSVLRLANSARYGLPHRVYSLHQAISLMGFDEIQQIVVTASVISFMDKTHDFFSLNNFWRHSIGVANATCIVANELGVSDDYILYTTALLHDIGKLGNLLLDTKGYLQIIQQSLDSHRPLHQLEMIEVFPEHTRMGEAICEHWGLPKMISQAIRYHHEPNIDHRPPMAEEINHTIDCIYLADVLIRQYEFGHSGNAEIPELNEAFLDRLDLHPVRLEQLKIQINEGLNHVHGLLDILPEEYGVA